MTERATDQWARDVLRRAWPASLAAPGLSELQIVQSVGRHEGYYGFASSPPGWAGSNNWGAIQCPGGAPCPEGCFETTDTHADGSSYRACFKTYPTAEAGAADLIRTLYRRSPVVAALRAGDVGAVARAMRATGYYEAPAAQYAAALARNARAIASSLGEPLVATPDSGGGWVLAGLALWAATKWWPTWAGRKAKRS